MAKKIMSETQKKILNIIVKYQEKHGYPPTVREIGESIGLKSSSSVHAHLRYMFKNKILETDASEGSPRAIRVPGYKYTKEKPELDFDNTIQLFEYLKELEDKGLDTFGLKPGGEPYSIRQILTGYFGIMESK